MNKIGTYEFLAEPFHCDFSQHLFMGHLGNHMLNAADFHSSARGFGMKYLLTINRSWVLSRLAIEMDEMPVQYTKFNVETWVESAMRYFTSRNFRVVGEDGKVYGYGRSIWAMIDTETRQPTDIFAIDNGAINNWIVKDKECPIDKGGRVKMSDDATFVRTIDTHYNDVDINGHINSVKYIEHILDLWPIDWYRTHRIRRFEIAYVAEAHAGDQLSFFKESGVGSQESGVGSQESGVNGQESGVNGQESGVGSQETGVSGQESGVGSQETVDISRTSLPPYPRTSVFNIRITKSSPDGPVEVCRSKVVFISAL